MHHLKPNMTKNCTIGGVGQQSCKVYQNYKGLLKHHYQTLVLYVSDASRNFYFLLIFQKEWRVRTKKPN